jgi:hypothetical protein
MWRVAATEGSVLVLIETTLAAVLDARNAAFRIAPISG